jgi:hypothetical protein
VAISLRMQVCTEISEYLNFCHRRNDKTGVVEGSSSGWLGADILAAVSGERKVSDRIYVNYRTYWSDGYTDRIWVRFF